MNSIEQARFNPLYQQMQQALLLQGKRPKTIEAYSRGVRRVADYVDRCPDNLTADELKSYFASLVHSHSWSTVKLDRNGIVSISAVRKVARIGMCHCRKSRWMYCDVIGRRIAILNCCFQTPPAEHNVCIAPPLRWTVAVSSRQSRPL